jgi:biopolymer transport protein ExbD
MSEGNTVDVDMTPMIDIVFQLITFFMVVINFEAADADERVKMAVSDLARPPKVKAESELVLQVGFERTADSEGNVIKKEGPFLFAAGENIPVAQIETKFRELLRKEFEFDRLKGNLDASGKSKSTVVIRADAECSTGDVQRLIRVCQEVGYERFVLKAMQPEAQ